MIQWRRTSVAFVKVSPAPPPEILRLHGGVSRHMDKHDLAEVILAF